MFEENIGMGLISSRAPTLQDVWKVSRGRENFYAFLSRLFGKEVDEEALKMIIASQPTVDFLASSQQTKELKDGNRLLRNFVDQAKSLNAREKQDLLTGLAAEYADLFLGLRSKPVLVCESAYLGEYRMYYGKPFSQVKDLYGRSGFEKRKNFLEPEDHVAVELDFMANLCRQTHLSLDEKNVQNAVHYLAMQKEFLMDHVLRWVPDLCETLKKTAESSLYKSLASLTSGFISMEAGVVDELAKTLENFREQGSVRDADA
jgi:anaerobic sulfite reductase subunit A